MSLLSRRMMMAIAGMEEDSVVKTGYFDVEHTQYPDAERMQVSTTDYLASVETGLEVIPEHMICVYIDEMETYNAAAAVFVGSPIRNAYAYNDNSAGAAEEVPFTDSAAQYMRLDENGILYLHITQWKWIKTGKWMWIAIYPEQ